MTVISAGFADAGPAGAAGQRALVEKVRAHGMRMVGPNCLGVLNADLAVRLNASFSPVFPPPGRIAMSSQSGAVGLAALSAARRYGLGFSTFVSVGNKADVSGNDLLQYWEEDPATDVILLYLESFGNPRRFARVARRVGRRKPVVVLHSGLTRTGARAAGSHTAALATNATAVEAAVPPDRRDPGRLAGRNVRPGPRPGVPTAPARPPGGHRHQRRRAGHPVRGRVRGGRPDRARRPAPDLHAKLLAQLPGAASINNPIDLMAGAGADAYRTAVETLLTSGEVEAVIAIFTPVGLADAGAVARAVTDGVAAARAAGAKNRPVLACVLGEDGRSHLEGAGERVPCYPFPEIPARVLGKAAEYCAWRTRPPERFPEFENLDAARAKQVCRRVAAERGEGWLSAEEVQTVLDAIGLPLVPFEFARTADEAVAAAARLRFPVAVKLASRHFVHKTEVAGVQLGLTNADAVRRAVDEIRHRVERENRPGALDGVTVHPMVSGGVEVLIGVTQDPLFGPLVAVGLGGIHVEVTGDVCFRVAPLSTRDAAEMVRGIRGYRLLEGYRGHAPADVEAIEEVLLRVSRLAEEVPEIREIDLNPVFAFPPGQGCRVADARIRVRPVK
ncbi:acetate--CoA ligase family protein [Frigoriglobus tundricola]|uniref:acetate--CoA ligase family protein n=1 Tax=Frigoriglobus tundricola TaxID=2774151 RepID=UPI00148E9660|nr:acetate--CoA ligase family protein [Frigoriglobus tundricola]